MKKLLYTLLLLIIIIPLYGMLNHVYADGTYVVSHIEDNGGLTAIESYSSYDDAYNKMKENEDYVITQKDSLSPNKIIAMNSGLVFSYPYRSNSNTMNIYESLTEKWNGTGATSYMRSHVEMTYHATTKYFLPSNDFPFGHGYLEVTLNGFRGYVDLENCDLVPFKYIKNAIAIKLGGNSKGTYSSESIYTVTPKQHYYYVKQNGNYKDLCMEYYIIWPESGTTPITGKIAYGVAPTFMEVGKNYYSDDGINFFSDRELKNKVGTYYNYYQFVPLRSYSNIKASTINSYIKNGSGNSGVMLNTGDNFINNQNIYSVNGASIAAMGIHESGWGKSSISNDKYNLFGWAAYDANTKAATTYSSVSECIAAQMGDNLSNYLDVQCGTYFTMSLGNKGGGFITKYASDPYWAEKIASYYYGMDKLDNSNNGKLTDYNSVCMALVNQNVSIKKGPSASSGTLYNSCNKTGYQKNLIVNVLSVENGYAKTRLSNPVKNGEVVYPITLTKGTKVEYDKDASIGYIPVSNLTFLNGEAQETIDINTLSISSYIRDITLNNTTLYIEGIGTIKGLNATNKSDIKHELIFYNYDNNNESKTFVCDTNEAVYNLNDGKDYKYSKFSKSISLTDIPKGNYGIKLKITNGSYVKEAYLLCAEIEYNQLSTFSNNFSYLLKCNQLSSYRIELFVNSLDNSMINYSNVKKVSIRDSMLTFDDIKLVNDNETIKLEIKAHGFMYYLDYSNNASPVYNIYLINDDGETLKYIAEIIDAPTNYAQVLGLSNDLTNICFKTDIDVSELNGDYRMVVELSNTVSNTKYLDYVELSNLDNYSFDPVTYNSKTYSISTGTRGNLSLNIH